MVYLNQWENALTAVVSFSIVLKLNTVLINVNMIFSKNYG